MKLQYFTGQVVASTAATNATVTFQYHGNSIWDCNQNGSGGGNNTTVYGHDKVEKLWQDFYVMGSKFEVRVLPRGVHNADEQMEFMIYANKTTLPSNQLDNNKSAWNNPRYKKVLIGGPKAGGKSVNYHLNGYAKTKTIIGQTGYDNSSLVSVMEGDPTIEWFWFLYIRNWSHSAPKINNVSFSIKITYYCSLTRPVRDVDMSTS